MKTFLLAALLLFITIGNYNHAQMVEQCAAHHKLSEYINSLSQEERAEYEAETDQYNREIKDYINNHPELRSDVHEKTILYTIPVVFHIIHDNGPSNISNEQIESCLNQMNRDFQKLNSGANNVAFPFKDIVADVQVEFKLAKLDPNGNCTNGITRTYSTQTKNGEADRVEIVRQAQGNWPGNKYLNVYVSETIGQAAGYTFYPDNNWHGTDMSNGIHVRSNYVGGIGTSEPIRSHTLTHEIGHWLNLPHVWGSTNEPGLPENCETDDGVEDTPNTIGNTTCKPNAESCGSLDNIENFMEYAYCYKMFTLGQKARMHAALNSSVGGRSYIWSAQNLQATGVDNEEVLCKAEFSSTYNNICLGSTVTFYDQSYSGVTERTWQFEGGVPSVSNSMNPIIQYNTPGTYSVTLIVSDGTDSKVTTKSGYVTVGDAGILLPFADDFEENLISDFWKIESNGGTSNFELTSDAAYSGSQSLKLENNEQQLESSHEFISKPIDLSNFEEWDEITLEYKYSYRKREQGNTDRFSMYTSIDCGLTWIKVDALKAKDMSDNIIVEEDWVPQSQDDWKTQTFSNFNGNLRNANLMLKFEFEAKGGNNFYIDDINITVESTLSNNHEVSALKGVKIYPNPTQENTSLSFYLSTDENIEIYLVNMMGQVINKQNLQATKGLNNVEISTLNLETGMYLVKLKTENGEVVKRLIIE